jgi:signal transduction histidine kinase
MDEIRSAVAEMQVAQDRLVTERSARAAETRDWLQWSILAPFLAVFALGIYVIANMNAQTKELSATLTKLRETNRALNETLLKNETAESQIRQMQKMEAIGQLTGGIAHDFNNMLAIIIGSLNLMQKRIKRGESDVGRFVDAAVDGANRAAKLTQHLLAFSRQLPLAPTTLEINRMISNMSDLLRLTLGENIHVETVLSGGLWTAHADSSQLENAILNIAVNARDAMNGNGRFTIESGNAYLDDVYVSQHADIVAGQYVLIAMTDTGTGMAPETAMKAFDPFFTTKEVGRGTGLGLSQVYGFVKQSNGHVKIYSEIGQGTTIKIYLPRYIAPQEQPRPQEEPRKFKRIENASDYIILVVEDDDKMRQLSVEALRELGYVVLHANGAEQALEILAGHQDISLLFTDIVMPEMNGRMLAERATQLIPGLRVLYTTGYTRNAVVHNGMLDPGTEFLPKPFSIDELAAKMQRILAKA